MKRNKNRTLNFIAGRHACLALAALCLSPAAHATPYTYEFSIAYDFSDDPLYFGSAALLDVTVDNGGATNADQSYAWSDIAYLNVSTVGGSFSLSTQYPPDYFTNPYYSTPGMQISIGQQAATDNTALFHTDPTGANAVFAGTGLDELFTQSWGQYRSSFSAQLGAGANKGLSLSATYFAPYCNYATCWQGTAYTQTIAAGLSGVLITPNPVYLQTVPLPASGALLVTGLLALGAGRNRRSAG